MEYANTDSGLTMLLLTVGFFGFFVGLGLILHYYSIGATIDRATKRRLRESEADRKKPPALHGSHSEGFQNYLSGTSNMNPPAKP